MEGAKWVCVIGRMESGPSRARHSYQLSPWRPTSTFQLLSSLYLDKLDRLSLRDLDGHGFCHVSHVPHVPAFRSVRGKLYLLGSDSLGGPMTADITLKMHSVCRINMVVDNLRCVITSLCLVPK